MLNAQSLNFKDCSGSKMFEHNALAKMRVFGEVGVKNFEIILKRGVVIIYQIIYQIYLKQLMIYIKCCV